MSWYSVNKNLDNMNDDDIKMHLDLEHWSSFCLLLFYCS